MATIPGNVAHPLLAPVITGSDITVDLMLQDPTRVTRMLADLTLQRFIVDRIFPNAGGVTGGAVVYDQQDLNELYADRDVERVEPLAEFPLISTSRKAPKPAEVEKWGGKVVISDEARTRNNGVMFTNQLRQLANTITRKVNQRAVAELEASIAATGQVMTGRNWNAIITAGTSASNNDAYPARDFAIAQLTADEDELGVTFDLWIMNPAQLAQLRIVYGDRLQAVLQSYGLDVYASNRVAPGTAYAVASGQVGEMRLEKPLGTEIWREPGIEGTYVQASVRPVMYVTNPYSVLKVTGLAG